MRILVTGSRGFVGRHVHESLTAAGHEAIGMILPAEGPVRGPHECEGDICDASGLRDLIRKWKPDAALHLAGIAFVPVAWSKPEFVFEVNVQGTLNLLEAFRAEAPAARLLIVSSSQIYGLTERDRAITEDMSMDPDSLYAVSKMAADLSSLLYARRYGMAVMTARPCNHIGPGQSPDFAVPSFARQAMEIAAGRAEQRIRVGNLESTREFMDVRDVAEAYRLILEKGESGRAYNIGSGTFIRSGLLLEKICALTHIQPSIEVDPARYRPTDAHPVMDASRLRADTGWAPRYSLDQTLMDVLDAMRPPAG